MTNHIHIKTPDVTNLTELAEFFPASVTHKGITKVRGVSGWQPGETYEQALARQRLRTARIQKQMRVNKSIDSIKE